jgi:hypothetical protein
MQVCGGAFTDLYPQSIIERWRTPFKEDISIAFWNDIYPALSAEQKLQLGQVALVFPDRCPDHRVCAADTEPFTYFAGLDQTGKPTIVMSVQSIRFWADLALSFAWLAANEKSAAFPSLYMSMLRYQSASRFPDGHYPLVIDALGIPEQQARKDARIMSTFQDIFVSGIYYILAHELAHLVYRHPGNGDNVSREVSRNNEMQADEFAAKLLAQIGQPPAGIVFFLQVFSQFAPNKLDENYLQQVANMTHPLDSDRLRKLSTAVGDYARWYARRQKNPAWSEQKIRETAIHIAGLADTLDMPDYDKKRLDIGRNITPELLQESIRKDGAGQN